MKKNNQKGVALIIILFSKIKLIDDIGKSDAAISIANSNVEKTLYYDRMVIPNGSVRGICSICRTCPTDASDPLGDPMTHCNNCTTTALSPGDCSAPHCGDTGAGCMIGYTTTNADGLLINSIGSYKGSTRQIQVNNTDSVSDLTYCASHP